MGNEIKVFVGGTEYRLTDAGAQAEIDVWKARAEKAERERDEALDGVKGKSAELARLDSLLAQGVDERDEARAMRDNLERALIDQVCPSCGGPLTCAKCDGVDHRRVP
jgi:hypothetical protein